MYVDKRRKLSIPYTSASSHFLQFVEGKSVVRLQISNRTWRRDNKVRCCIWRVSSVPTFAISLQLFPASLICFNRSSSAGVHGVFVRLFLSLGSCAGLSTSAATCGVALLACASTTPVELDMVSGS